MVLVCSGQQFGSGGRTIGKEVAAKLGIPCYDSELIDKIATQSGFAKEYGEYALSDKLYKNVLAGRDQDAQSDVDKIWFAQKKVATDLAEKESCVIVGCCADYILKDTSDCLTVFIHSLDEQRAERIVSVYGQREESPAKRLHDKDKTYYELYTGINWGMAENYDTYLF